MSHSVSQSKPGSHRETLNDSRVEPEVVASSQGASDEDRTASTDPTSGRSRRARTEEMDVSLLRRGGVYEVRSASGNIYEVNVLEKSCTCPDHRENEQTGGCKHLRRVDHELQAGLLPRPDGKLPTNQRMMEGHSVRVSRDQYRNGANSGDSQDEEVGSHEGVEREPPHTGVQLVSEMQQREEEIARIDAELQALQFVSDVLDRLRAGKGFDLKQMQEDEAGPSSRL